MDKTKGIIDWFRWITLWASLPPLNAREESVVAPLIRFRRKRDWQRRWARARAADRAIRRDDQPIDTIDFGAQGEALGRTRTRTLGDIARGSSVDRRKAAWLLAAARLTSAGPVEEGRPFRVLEVGTCLGSGAMAMLSGVEGDAAYVGLEGSPELVRRAHRRMAAWSEGRTKGHLEIRVEEGPFADVLPRVLREGWKWDLVYLDGHHSGEVLLSQWEDVIPHVAPGGVVVIDDIRWSKGMHAAWNQIVQQGGGDGLDAFRLGLVVMPGAGGHKSGAGLAFRAPIALWA